MISCSDALHIIEPYFDVVLERYLEAGWDRVRHTRLRCDPGMHDTPRHFAGCLLSGKIIYVAPELVDLPQKTMLGILAHELGHATDFLYPGEFQLRGTHVRHVEANPQTLKGWKRRDDDSVEITADFIAEMVLGTPIGYRGPCQLQNLGVPNRPRPLGLR